MKVIYKSITTLALLLCFSTSYAQLQHGKPFISIGTELNKDIRGSYKIGIGGSIKLGLPVSQRSTITFSTGYTSFIGKTFKFQGTEVRNLTMNTLPLRIGWRYSFNKGIYLEPQVGYSKIMFEKTTNQLPSFGAFSYGFNFGVIKRKHWDISTQYQGFTNKNKYAYSFHSVGVRIAYKFNIKK